MPGSRQKRARIAAREAKEVVGSKLAFVILTAIVRGACSPQFGQKLAQAGLDDVKSTLDDLDVLPELTKIASIGTNGKHPQNCRTDLFNRVASVPRLIASVVMLPIKNLKHVAGWKLEPAHLLLPHEVFSQMYASYKVKFHELFMPSVAKVLDFWTAVRQHPLLRNNPLLDIPDWMTTVVPLWMHGDGVATVGVAKSWSKMMDCISFGSMLSTHNTTFDSCFMSWSKYKAACSTKDGLGHTMNQYWSIMRWSWEVLFEGRHPYCNHLGVAYAPDSVQGRRAGDPLVELPCGRVIRGMVEYPFDHFILFYFRPRPPGPLPPPPSPRTVFI